VVRRRNRDPLLAGHGYSKAITNVRICTPGLGDERGGGVPTARRCPRAT
jgi:hypothetical protein